MSEENVVAKEWVYRGQRVSKGKRIYAWASPSGVGHYSKPLASASVGSVYRFYETADGNSFKTTGKYAPSFLRRHDNQEDVQLWAAEDEAAKQQLAVKSLNTKAAKADPLDELFAGLRRVTRQLNSLERRALMSRIADEVFGGRV